jgi:hypothetical protein
MPQYLSREEAAQYLRERYGAPVGGTIKTLRTVATRGGGPVFIKFGTRVAYTREDLDQWIAARARRVGSTSEVE